MKKSKIRAYQDRVTNRGWRIALIPHDDATKTQITKTNPVALLGMAVFVWGVVAFFNSRESTMIALAVLGVAIMVISMWLTKVKQQRKWITVTAKSLDQEVQKRRAISAGSELGAHSTWEFRILCEFGYKGRTFQATPIHWRSFGTQGKAEAFLSEKIGTEGNIWLRINPDNPLQVELV